MSQSGVIAFFRQHYPATIETTVQEFKLSIPASRYDFLSHFADSLVSMHNRPRSLPSLSPSPRKWSGYVLVGWRDGDSLHKLHNFLENYNGPHLPTDRISLDPPVQHLKARTITVPQLELHFLVSIQQQRYLPS
ncbi:hypothetical protein RCL1_007240 [Eukaryota sp. TZLM3-RCL]